MPKEFFDYFKRQSLQKGKISPYHDIYFQINFDPHGAYLEVIDKNGNTTETSYLSYAGATRNVLRAIENINEKNSFVIDWEKPQDKIYLQEYPFLIDALQMCDNLVDSKMKDLQFSNEQGAIQLAIQTNETDKESLHTDLLLYHLDKTFNNFQAITESFVLTKNNIIEIEPLGLGFAHLQQFKSTFYKKDLSLFLSLLYSNLDQVKLAYEDYQFNISKEKVLAKPCLFFERIDEENALYLRVGQTLADLDILALQQYELYRFAEINELEKIITIKLIEQEPTEVYVNEILKLLKKRQPKKKKEDREEILLDDFLFIIPEDTAAAFIYNELPNLLQRYMVFGAEKLKTYKINTAAPKLSMSLSHEIDFFEGDVDLDFDGDRINLFDAIDQYNKQRYILLSDGSHALLNEQYIRRLERLFKKKQKGKKAQLSFFDLPEAEDLINQVAEQKVFEKSRAFYEGFNLLKKQKVKIPKIKATLRPYQVQGYKWLSYLKENKLGGCLADDMGLGKTIQTIALLAADYPKEKKPTLIVMPKSLLYNWEREVETFAPQLKTYMFYGTERDLKKVRKADLVFTTYAIMRNEIKNLKEEHFHYLILDESQNIKNINAQTTKAALMLKSDLRLALSGTPIENNLGELYSLFQFLNPSMFGSVSRFNDDFLTPIQKGNDNAAILALRKKIYPFVLRRLKKDVLDDLPDKIEQTLMIKMSVEQEKLYHQRRSFYQTAIKEQIASKGIQSAQFFIFQALNELRQIATIPEKVSEGKVKSPKLELLSEQLFDALANGHKILIFVNFLAAIESISNELNEAGINYVSMTGATRNRQVLVNKFQNDPACKVFLMTLKTGGVGLNLTAADTIFIYDPWWNVAAENQAIDRAHRIGQQNKVLAYKLITEGTIEEKILKLQELKRELFDNVISSDSASVKSLSADEIDNLLS